MEITNHLCPSCGANLEYNVRKKSWVCGYCRKMHNSNNLRRKKTVKDNINEATCPTCSAKLLVDNNIISNKCIYCKTNIVVNKTNDSISMPDKIIPFSITKDMAIDEVNTIINKKRLLPKDFKIIGDDIQAIYVPFWLYSNKYKVIVRDKYFRILKRTEMSFNLIPYDANTHIDNKITKSIEPFNYDYLIDFDSAYLSGVVAQKYDVLSDIGEDDINKRCITSIYEFISNKNSKFYVKDAQRINETLINQNKYYALFPIWFLNTKYKNNEYLIVINGQTGKIVGNLPIDKTKYTLITFLIFIISFSLLLFIFLLLRWLGVRL